MRLYIKVTPRSSRLSFEQTSTGEYRARLTAPPVDGWANEQLRELVSGHFHIAKSRVHIVGGKTSRLKMVDIEE